MSSRGYRCYRCMARTTFLIDVGPKLEDEASHGMKRIRRSYVACEHQGCVALFTCLVDISTEVPDEDFQHRGRCSSGDCSEQWPDTPHPNPPPPPPLELSCVAPRESSDDGFLGDVHLHRPYVCRTCVAASTAASCNGRQSASGRGRLLHVSS
jgi:hypothetical protein